MRGALEGPAQEVPVTEEGRVRELSFITRIEQAMMSGAGGVVQQHALAEPEDTAAACGRSSEHVARRWGWRWKCRRFEPCAWMKDDGWTVGERESAMMMKSKQESAGQRDREQPQPSRQREPELAEPKPSEKQSIR